jgi:magnesium-transporting ATPase (P-type)
MCKQGFTEGETMDKKKVFLIIQSLLWILVAGLLIASVISIYRDGTVLRAEDPLAAIFSRQIAAKALMTIAPLFFAAVVMTVAGLVLGIRDEDGLKPVKGGKVENRAPEGKTLRTVLLVAAIVLIVAGVFNGSARDVFGKAVKICTECIGLG